MIPVYVFRIRVFELADVMYNKTHIATTKQGILDVAEQILLDNGCNPLYETYVQITRVCFDHDFDSEYAGFAKKVWGKSWEHTYGFWDLKGLDP